jgi:hypothetical protein
MNHTKKQLPTKPFFTRFLEKQELRDVTGGGEEQSKGTLKFPSDTDEVSTDAA